MISEIDIRDWGTHPVKPIESKDQYEHYLKTFDWNYEFSDDHYVWKRGQQGLAYLWEASAMFDPEKIIWKAHAPISR